MRRRFASRALVALAGARFAAWPSAATAQEPFPSRALRFVVPYPPGASTDNLARVFARELAREFKAGVEGATAVMAGDIDGCFATVGLAATLKDNARAKLVALTGSRGPNKFLPGLKSFAELGMDDMVFRSLYGVAVRAETPPAIRTRLAQAVLKVAGSDEMRAARESIALEDYPGTVEDYRREVQANLRMYQAAKAQEDGAAR